MNKEELIVKMSSFTGMSVYLRKFSGNNIVGVISFQWDKCEGIYCIGMGSLTVGYSIRNDVISFREISGRFSQFGITPEDLEQVVRDEIKNTGE